MTQRNNNNKTHPYSRVRICRRFLKPPVDCIVDRSAAVVWRKLHIYYISGRRFMSHVFSPFCGVCAEVLSPSFSALVPWAGCII